MTKKEARQQIKDKIKQLDKQYIIEADQSIFDQIKELKEYKEAETILDKINITTNKNTIPNDTESPFKTSGLRIGTPAMTTRGFTTEDLEEVGIIINDA